MKLASSLLCIAQLIVLAGCGDQGMDQMFKFGKNRKSTQPAQTQNQRSAEEMRSDPDLIRVHDAYGREMFIEKAVWRKDVLPGTLKDAWDDPEELYGVIYGALNDGFEEDVVDAAVRLNEIDTAPERGACVLGIVYMKIGRLDDAERVLKTYIKEYGEDGSVLTNLAKVYAAGDQHELSEQTLWHALEVDPNQDNGLGWYEVIHRERGGREAGQDALRRVADLPNSWRAQLWLARTELEAGNREAALQFYKTSLSRVESPVPTDLLMQMSGDLGSNGHLKEIIELTEPHYDASVHGLSVGNNLILTYRDLGNVPAARKILEGLYALNRPDWKPQLEFWDNELEQHEHQYGPVAEQDKISATVLMMPWPVWGHKIKELDRLMPPKGETDPAIAFFAASCSFEKKLQQTTLQRPEQNGKLSRCIPLYLAEQVQMLTASKGIFLVPVISGEGSFILSGAESSDENFLEQVEKIECDYAVKAHLNASGPVWKMKLTLYDVRNQTAVCVVSDQIDPDDPAQGVEELSLKMMKALRLNCGVKKADPPIKYEVLRGSKLNGYLSITESSLALTAATSKDIEPDFLFGTRRTFDSLIDLNLDNPQSEVYRLMFIGALAKNKAYDSDLYLDYRQKVETLQVDHPIDGLAAVLAADTLESLYADRDLVN